MLTLAGQSFTKKTKKTNKDGTFGLKIFLVASEIHVNFFSGIEKWELIL